MWQILTCLHVYNMYFSQVRPQRGFYFHFQQRFLSRDSENVLAKLFYLYYETMVRISMIFFDRRTTRRGFRKRQLAAIVVIPVDLPICFVCQYGKAHRCSEKLFWLLIGLPVS